MRASLAFALVLTSSLAFAQSAADVATARDLFREGMELRAQGHLAEALAKLKAAHDLYETPPSALELARTQIDLGRLAEGYETLLSIERIPSAKDSERSKQARAEAKDLESKTKVRIPTLRIDVQGSASVTLDGAVVSPALFGVARKVDPGKHVVGCESKRIEVDVPEGQAISVPCEPDVQMLGPIGGVAAPSPRRAPIDSVYSTSFFRRRSTSAGRSTRAAAGRRARCRASSGSASTAART